MFIREMEKYITISIRKVVHMSLDHEWYRDVSLYEILAMIHCMQHKVLAGE